MAILDLPCDKKNLVLALDREIGAADLECNVHIVAWKIADGFLSGLRHFRILNRLQASMEVAYENDTGGLNFRYEKVLRDYTTECGRLMKMDVLPVATRKGESLDSLRKAAMARAVLSSTIKTLDLNNVKAEFVKMVVKYGTAGLEFWESSSESSAEDDEVVEGVEYKSGL